jgi:hypothetical protein
MHKGCKNPIRTDAPIRYCYLHEHEQLAVTPKGQHGFRNTTGRGSWQYRLQKERESEFPPNSAGVKGYPFFTVEDLDGQVRFMSGEARYQSTSENILERFPLQSVIMMGRDISGNEVAVIDGGGNIHLLDSKEPEYADEMRGFSVDNGSRTLGVADEERYQVIVIDDIAIAEAAVDHGMEFQKAS